MFYLIEFHLLWLLLALLLGGIVGLLSFTGNRPGWSGAGWLNLGLPLFLIGLAVAAFKLLPGKAGYWLDLALLFFGVYMIGCLLGSLLRSLFATHAEPAPATMVVPAATAAAAGAAGVAARAIAPAAKTPARKPAVTPIAPSPAAASHPGTKPPGLAPSAAAQKDDLKLIKGIGPKNEAILNSLGIYMFCQVAAWSPREAEWMGHHMAFPGRIERELWIEQAKVLCAGGQTEHSKAVRAGLPVDDTAVNDADVAKLKSGLPQVVEKVEGEDEHEGQRPFGMVRPLGGIGDDLKLINGVGKQNEAKLHGLGIWHFSQIAAWDRANIDWVGSYLAFPGRIDREKWVDQAKMLEQGIMTDFAQRVKRGDVATSSDEGSNGQNNV